MNKNIVALTTQHKSINTNSRTFNRQKDMSGQTIKKGGLECLGALAKNYDFVFFN